MSLIRGLPKKLLNLWKWVWNQLKDLKTFLIFIVVFIVMAAGVWVPYLLAILTGNAWWWGIGSSVWLFWAGPFTPFIPLCVTITLAIKKLFFKRRDK